MWRSTKMASASRSEVSGWLPATLRRRGPSRSSHPAERRFHRSHRPCRCGPTVWSASYSTTWRPRPEYGLCRPPRSSSRPNCARAQLGLDELLGGRHSPYSGRGLQVVEYDADQTVGPQRHGRCDRWKRRSAGWLLRDGPRRRSVAGNQPETSDLLADAIFVDLHIAGREVFHQPALLIADHQIQRYLIDRGMDHRPRRGTPCARRRILRANLARLQKQGG